jgi:hypothetical protein
VRRNCVVVVKHLCPENSVLEWTSLYSERSYANKATAAYVADSLYGSVSVFERFYPGVRGAGSNMREDQAAILTALRHGNYADAIEQWNDAMDSNSHFDIDEEELDADTPEGEIYLPTPPENPTPAAVDENAPALSIDDAIAKLQAIREKAKFGGDTTLVFCGVGSGIEYKHIADIQLEQDDVGAVVRIDVKGLEGLGD